MKEEKKKEKFSSKEQEESSEEKNLTLISPQLSNVETSLRENLKSEDNSVDNEEKGVTQKEKDTGKKEIDLGERKPVEKSVQDTWVSVHTHCTQAQKNKEKEVRETILDNASGGDRMPDILSGGGVPIDSIMDGKGEKFPPVPSLSFHVERNQKEKSERNEIEKNERENRKREN